MDSLISSSGWYVTRDMNNLLCTPNIPSCAEEINYVAYLNAVVLNHVV